LKEEAESLWEKAESLREKAERAEERGRRAGEWMGGGSQRGGADEEAERCVGEEETVEGR
jgi:hypothetical protein